VAGIRFRRDGERLLPFRAPRGEGGDQAADSMNGMAGFGSSSNLMLLAI
jgi:hypothetical protein